MQSRINISMLFPSPGLQQCWHAASPLCHHCVNTLLPLPLCTQSSSQPQDEQRDQINWSCFPKRPEWERGNVSVMSEMENCVAQ